MPATLTKAIPIPIKELVINLDDLGYPGWKAVMWTNPPAALWDNFLEAEIGSDEEWEAYGKLFISWNFGDKDGNLLPLPGLGEGLLKRGILPSEVTRYLIDKYYENFRKNTQLPKESETNSSNSLPTSASDQKTDVQE